MPYVSVDPLKNRTDSSFAPSQWETSLQSNAVSNWLGAKLESGLENSVVICHAIYQNRDKDKLDNMGVKKLGFLSSTYADLCQVIKLYSWFIHISALIETVKYTQITTTKVAKYHLIWSTVNKIQSGITCSATQMMSRLIFFRIGVADTSDLRAVC